VLTLRDYNTRVVAAGSVLLGIAAATVGVFMLLRRRSLVSDVISHASLPGIALSFLVLEAIAPGSGKSLPGLLIGALISGFLGIACTMVILRYTRIKSDAALAIVLSVFFGFGIALLTVIQKIPSGNSAGLPQFIYGKAASMVSADVQLIAGAAVVIVLILGLLFKELALLTFDERFAAAQGWPVTLLDLTLMTLVTGVTVIALQSVGLLLAVAMLVIPAAAARFWTDRLVQMTLLAALLGGLSAVLGVLASALFPRVAAGAVIVLTGSALFLFSLLFGTRRGLLIRLRMQRLVQRSVGRHHVLRALFEYLEPQLGQATNLDEALTQHVVPEGAILPMRSWTPARLRKLLAAAEAEGLVGRVGDRAYRLTPRGAQSARRVVRNHRLWELYLIEYADIAPSHVDRDADDIEHLLSAEVVESLKQLLAERYPQMSVPPSPHVIEALAETG
jgi:manganese/zinc/iron transport system permease protein